MADRTSRFWDLYSAAGGPIAERVVYEDEYGARRYRLSPLQEWMEANGAKIDRVMRDATKASNAAKRADAAAKKAEAAAAKAQREAERAEKADRKRRPERYLGTLSPSSERSLALLRAEVDRQVAELAERLYQGNRRVFDAMVRDVGPTLERVYDHRLWSDVWRKSRISAVVRRYTRRYNEPVADAVFLEDKAREITHAQAQATMDALFAKLVHKVGALDDLETEGHVSHFNLMGTRAGHRIRIEQNIIVNVSSKGTVFNQFPSRIYVDGQFKSEADYKRMFGDPEGDT